MFGRTLRCSFCGRSEREVAKLIAGAKGHICDRCVRLCDAIIKREESTPAATGKTPDP